VGEILSKLWYYIGKIWAYIDKLGLFIGVVLSLFSFPLTSFVAVIPLATFSKYITNDLVLLTSGIFLVLVGGFLNLISSITIGVILSYCLRKVSALIHLTKYIESFHDEEHPVERSLFSKLGAFIGAGVGFFVFFTEGGLAVSTVAQRVENLFPFPIILYYGEQQTINISHIYSMLTGFLTIGFLCIIIGIVLGSLAGILIDRLVLTVRM